MHDPMTPHYISLVLMGCNKLHGSSFSPFMDDFLPVCPRKRAFFHEKCIFGHFATFGDLRVRPHDPFWPIFAVIHTDKCSRVGSYQDIESHFISFHFFSFMNLRCNEFPDLGPFGTFAAPLWVPPHHVCLFLWQTHYLVPTNSKISFPIDIFTDF